MSYRYSCAHCGVVLAMGDAGVLLPCPAHPGGQILWALVSEEVVDGG